MSERPRVLLLGDSIRLSYQSRVTEQLKDSAEVVGAEENGRWAANTLLRLPVWLDELGVPDIVHWNNGIWDCGHWPTREPAKILLEDYVVDLAKVLTELRKVTDRIIWASTTPIHPDKTEHDSGWQWDVEDVDRYNAGALELMISEGVQVNDLNAVVKANFRGNLADDYLHLSESGMQCCADAVVSAITKNMTEQS
jgi:lysophospholipase L1-like esterase